MNSVHRTTKMYTSQQIKAFADDNLNEIQMIGHVLDRVENNKGKGENVNY